MRPTKIYQTLENRNNNKEIEKHGPYYCSLLDGQGEIKVGAKAPWLGEGYYFWDTHIEDAHWWGQTVYKDMGYVICQTTYDAHSPLLYDLLGDLEAFDEFVKIAQLVKKVSQEERVSFAVVLQYLKNHTGFAYRAVRVMPVSISSKITDICFPKFGIYLAQVSKVQICFFDKTLLQNPFTITKTHDYTGNLTI